jgi:2-iminobutanoate/2-iminopropanoate deaminase
MTVKTVTAPSIGGTYSSTTVHGTAARGFVFVTGQIGNSPGTDPVDRPEEIGELGSIEDQAVRVCENVKAILEAAGTSLEHVVKRNVYITHLADYEPVYRVFERYFPHKVASTGVICALVPQSARVELDVIAALPGD